MSKEINNIKNFGKFLNENEATGAEKFKSFKNELKTLLNKYNASINCLIDGDDLSGLTTKMVIEIDKKDYILNSDSYIDKHEL